MSHSIYNITVLIYCCVLTEYNTLYKFVTKQRVDLSNSKGAGLKSRTGRKYASFKDS